MAAPQAYYTPAEVEIHKGPTDLWVSFLGKVLDLSSLAKKYEGDKLMHPLILHAGQDISHWFDSTTGDLRYHIDRSSGRKVPYTPDGLFVDVPPSNPTTKWDGSKKTSWWKDISLQIGFLSSQTRRIRIINMLTSEEQELEVCSEESMIEIQRRYKKHNRHAGSYTWKYDGKLLDMSATLEDNGIKDESAEFSRLRIRRDKFLPELHVFWNDDLTEA